MTHSNIMSIQNLYCKAQKTIQVETCNQKRRFYEILCNVTKIALLFNAIASIGASALCSPRAVGRSENPEGGACSN